MKKFEKELLKDKFLDSGWGGCLINILGAALFTVIIWAIFNFIIG